MNFTILTILSVLHSSIRVVEQRYLQNSVILQNRDSIPIKQQLLSSTPPFKNF